MVRKRASSLEFNGRSTYRQDLAKELKEIDEQEIWRVGECSCTRADRVSIDCMILQVRPYGRCGLITNPSECLDWGVKYYIVEEKAPGCTLAVVDRLLQFTFDQRTL